MPDDSAAYIAFQLGPLPISHTVLTTWGIVFFFSLVAWLMRQSPKLENIGEIVVVAIEGAISEVLPAASVHRVLPFVGTLWLFLLIANLTGLIPEMHAPTRDISATAALAVLVFGSTHWFGIRGRGLSNHLRHYLQPSIILLPFHIVSEFTRTLALAIRLFGNIMSLEMAATLVLLIAGFLAPVPLLMLHVLESLVQAYIFGMLALIYIAGALEANSSEISIEPQENL